MKKIILSLLALLWALPLAAQPVTTQVPVSLLAEPLTLTQKLTTVASASGGAGINLPPGTAPTSPVNGDLWVTSASLFARINGTTVAIAGTSPGGATTNVQYNCAGAFCGNSGFVYDGTSLVSLGVAGASVGQIAFRNATSGSITLAPVAGALGGITLFLPAGASDTLVTLTAAQTLSSKTFIAPALGTPASGVMTNVTGVPISTGVSGLGTGVAAFLATPSSANLRTALTDETGTGAAVFATSPVLVTPNLGTPTALVLTNATALPLSTGVVGNLPVGNLAAGTNASATTFWNGTAAWLVPPGTFNAPGVDAVAACSVDNTGANDTTSALNTCLTNNLAVTLRPGLYKTSACITMARAGASLTGAGGALAALSTQAATTINIHSTTAKALCMANNGQHVANILLDRTGVPSSGADGLVNTADSQIVENIQSINHYRGFNLGTVSTAACTYCVAQYNYSDGFYLYANDNGQLQWNFTNTLAGKNNGKGYNVIADVLAGYTNILAWTNVSSFANTGGGFSFVANGSSLIVINNLTNLLSSSEGNDAVLFNTRGNVNVYGGFIENPGRSVTGRLFNTPQSNVGRCVHLTGSNALMIINGLKCAGASFDGLKIDNGAGLDVQVIGGSYVSNGFASSGVYSGIQDGDSGTQTTHLRVVGVGAYNDLGTGVVQKVGLATYSAITSIFTVNDTTISAGNITQGCFSGGGTIGGNANYGSGCP